MTNEEKAREIQLREIPNKEFDTAIRYDDFGRCLVEIADWKEQQMVEKAIDWLKDQVCYYSHWEWNGDTCENEIVVDTEKMVEDFKEAMNRV